MIIASVHAQSDWTLVITTTEGRVGQVDMRPYLQHEAFAALHNIDEFMHISNGGYFVEWSCGADLSADTLEARLFPALPA